MFKNFDLDKNIYFILAGGIFVISFAGIFVALSDAPPLIIAFYRMFLSVVILTPTFILRRDCHLSLFKDLRPVVVGFFLAIHFILWVSAFEYTAVANAVIFIALQPIFTLLFEAIWAREDLRPGLMIGVLLAVTGSFIVGMGDLGNLFANVFGDTLAALAAFFAGLYLFSGRSLRRELDYFPYIYIVYSYASLFLVLGVLISGTSFTGYGTSNWLYFIGLAAGPTVIGHSVLNLAVRFVPATLVSVAIIGEPILTTILAWILLGDRITILTFVGGAMILSGVVYTMLKQSRRAATTPPREH